MIGLVIFSLVWNTLVFLTYGLDKKRAVQRQWRLSERNLLIMTMMCGGFGACLGSQFFHHKTRKYYFTLAWCVGLLTNLGLAYLVWKLSH